VPPSALERRVSATPYAELHCHSTFSFLDGASHPRSWPRRRCASGLEALAITDHDGFYGVVRFAEAARSVGMPTVFGAELSLGLTKPQNGMPDPEGSHLLVLARDPEGYARLASTISAAQLRGAEKGKPIYDGIAWEEVHGDHWVVLTGCRKGSVPQALERHGPAAAARELDALIATFGRHNVVVELCDHGDPLDSHRNDALASMAVRAGLDVVATTNAHYASPAGRPLATAMAAVRARRSLDELDPWLPACAGAHLRSGDEQARRFARWPGAVEHAAELGHACAFDLHLVAPQLPPFPCPDGLSEMAYLRRLTAEGAEHRYGAWGTERVARRLPPDRARAGADRAARVPGLLPRGVGTSSTSAGGRTSTARGRGSAANSAVCYALASPTPTR
jgi:error-prone DNA polymerase